MRAEGIPVPVIMCIHIKGEESCGMVADVDSTTGITEIACWSVNSLAAVSRVRKYLLQATFLLNKASTFSSGEIFWGLVFCNFCRIF